MSKSSSLLQPCNIITRLFRSMNVPLKIKYLMLGSDTMADTSFSQTSESITLSPKKFLQWQLIWCRISSKLEGLSSLSCSRFLHLLINSGIMDDSLLSRSLGSSKTFSAGHLKTTIHYRVISRISSVQGRQALK